MSIEYKAEIGLFAQFWNDVETGRDPSAVGEMMIAATLAMRDVAALMKKEGRADIRAGGMGSKFANAWRVSSYPQKGYAIDPAAFGRHNIPYADIFEEGGTIRGIGGLLWLPLPTVPKLGKRRARPRELTGVDLFSINRVGHPPLLAAKIRNAGVNRNSRIRGAVSVPALRAGTNADKIRQTSRLKAKQRGGVKASNAGANIVSVPLFHGVPSVTLRKRFNLAGVTVRVAARFSEFYDQHIP